MCLVPVNDLKPSCSIQFSISPAKAFTWLARHHSTECVQALQQQLQAFVATAEQPGFVACARATRAEEQLRSACEALVYDALMLKVGHSLCSGRLVRVLCKACITSHT